MGEPLSISQVPPHKLQHRTTMGKRSLDLLYPTPEEEKRKHKLKRLVQSPNSFFMDVKCPGCFHITPVFSHAQIVVFCSACSTALASPLEVAAVSPRAARTARRWMLKQLAQLC